VTGAAALIGSLALGAVALRSAWSSRAGEPSADAHAKGELVRHAIDEAYRTLPVGNRADWRDVSPLVALHIPAGTSYDFAETILWHAGCGFTWARRTAAKPMEENLKRCPTLAADWSYGRSASSKSRYSSSPTVWRTSTPSNGPALSSEVSAGARRGGWLPRSPGEC